METDLILSAIDKIHRKANEALENKDIETYSSNFDEQLRYINNEGKAQSKKDYIADLTKYFKGLKDYQTSSYRIKSSYESEVFTEKIARKSILKIASFIILSKKQTIQTEEIYHWKNIEGEWKVVAVEITLEEKY